MFKQKDPRKRKGPELGSFKNTPIVMKHPFAATATAATAGSVGKRRYKKKKEENRQSGNSYVFGVVQLRQAK